MRVDPFYPIITLAAAAMLWFALTPGLEAEERWLREIEEFEEVGYVVDLERLNELIAAPGVTTYVTGEELSIRAVLRASMGPHEGVPSAGVFYTLPPLIARRARGRRLRVTVTARRTPNDGSESFLAAFFMFNGPDSGWQRFTPTDDFGNFEFEWQPPEEDIDRPALVGIWPSESGDDLGVELRRIRIEIVGELIQPA